MSVTIGVRTTSPVLSVSMATGGTIADAHYTHTQASASDTWTITHNLGKYPSVTCVDTAGTEIIGELQYTSLNAVTVTFSARNAGKAYCN